MCIELVMLSNHLILCQPLLHLPSIFPCIRVFSNEWALRIRWPKYWSFSVSPFNKYTELISFMIDWFNLLAFQGTLKSLFQHNLKATIIWHSAFFMVEISYLYMSATLEYLILISLCCVLRLSHFSKVVPFFFPPVSKAKSSVEHLAFQWHTADYLRLMWSGVKFLHFLVLHSFLMDSLHVSSLYGGPLLNIHLTNIYGTLQVIESETLIVNTYSWKCFYYKCGKG